MMVRLFDAALEDLGRALHFAARRHGMLVQNLANVETPGYKGRDLVFDDYLKPLLTPSPVEAMADLAEAGRLERLPRVVYAADGPPKPNGNDVSPDRQMARLAENTLFHTALAQILAGRFAALKQAISGRT